MKPNDDPLPDPVAYARGLSDEQLREYKRIYGEDSREWIIAKRELSRRGQLAWPRFLIGALAFAIALVVSARLADWSRCHSNSTMT